MYALSFWYDILLQMNTLLSLVRSAWRNNWDLRHVRPIFLKIRLTFHFSEIRFNLEGKKTYYLSSIVFCDGINPTLSWKVSYLFSVCFVWKTFYRKSVSYHHPHILGQDVFAPFTRKKRETSLTHPAWIMCRKILPKLEHFGRNF